MTNLGAKYTQLEPQTRERLEEGRNAYAVETRHEDRLRKVLEEQFGRGVGARSAVLDTALDMRRLPHAPVWVAKATLM